MSNHWSVVSLDGIIKLQRVRDYRIHFQVHIYITFQYLTFHTYCTHTSHTHTLTHTHSHITHSHTHTHTLTHHTLTHSQSSYAVCNLPPTRRICAPKCQIWDCSKVSKKCTKRKHLSKVNHTMHWSEIFVCSVVCCGGTYLV